MDENEILNTGTPEEFRKSEGIHRPEQKLSLYLAGCLATARTQQQRPLSAHEIEDVERQAAFDFAEEHGLWISDLYLLGVPLKGGGNENTLAYDKVNRVVYKSNNLFNSQNSLSKFLENIQVHNTLFPETMYELVGFTGIEKGTGKVPYIEPIVKQDYIPNAQQAVQEDIDNYMNNLGFDKINDHTFTNSEYTISDLRPRNVLKDANGTIYVVDDIILGNQQ